MKASKLFLKLAPLLVLGTFIGCESTDDGSTHSTTNVYYGVGYYDPWYHDHHDYDNSAIVVPPDRPDNPDRPGSGLHPSHPIAEPPRASSRPPTASPRPAARSTPSIPSRPRPVSRGGGGRR